MIAIRRLHVHNREGHYKMKIKIILIFVLFLLSVNIAFASDNLSIDIDAKDVFRDNEKIIIDYEIISDKDLDITYDFHFNCGYSNPVPLILRENIKLNKNQAYSKHIEDFIVNEYIRPADCTAYVRIIEPIQKSKEINFRIETKPIMEIFIDTCKDIDCNKKSRTFVKGETVYVKVYSVNDQKNRIDLDEVNGVASGKSFSTKDYSFVADNKGVFDINVDAKNSNYKSLKKRVNYFVIEKEPVIRNKFQDSVKISEDESIINRVINFFNNIF